MEEYSVKITDRAMSDLDSIASFLGDNNEKHSVYVYDEIVSRINTLKIMPRRYPYVQNEQLHELGYRGMFVFSYIVIYWVDDETNIVEIHRVMPARLGIDNLERLM